MEDNTGQAVTRSIDDVTNPYLETIGSSKSSPS